LTHLNDVARRIINNQEAQTNWHEPLPELAQTLSQQANDNSYIEQTFFADFVAVDTVEYFSDTHDKPFNKEAREMNKQLTEKFHDLFAQTERRLLIQTPYLVFSRQARDMFKKLRK